jgi:hypothetical protein
MRDIELALSLISQPRNAFAELDERPRFWFPLLLGLLCTLGAILWYYSVVDLDWFIDRSLNASARSAQMTEAQRAQAARMLSRNVLLLSSAGGGIFVLVLLRLLESAYLTLAGKITNVQRTFKHWFSLACWTSLPALLTVIPTVLLLALSDTQQIDPGVLQPLSLNELFVHRAMSQPGYTLLNSLSILQPMCWLLSVIGVRAWSQRSWVFSVVFALLPVILCYGGWAAFALTRT